MNVPHKRFEEEVKDIYTRVAHEMGIESVMVCNDGDVAALAGAIELDDNNVLGIAMGTSEAAGFIDSEGCIKGWLNELAFAPIDLGRNAALDEWSGDLGCGVKYFSQDAVIRLAANAGIDLDSGASPAEKLSLVQNRMNSGDRKAKLIYISIGVYMGHTLALYHDMYSMKNVLLLGRVMSGKGGEVIYKTALRV
jgi:predicted NBD/HSP70 family sugar kinase